MLERLIKDKIAEVVDKTDIQVFLDRLERIRFPNNPLDGLIDQVCIIVSFSSMSTSCTSPFWTVERWLCDVQLGGPENVAELSGRSKRLVWEGKRLRYIMRDAGVRDNKKLQSLSEKVRSFYLAMSHIYKSLCSR